MIDDAAPAGTREQNRLRVLEALLGYAATVRPGGPRERFRAG